MVNTHILTAEFDYLEPETVPEALHLLGKYARRAKVIAGGTDLLVQMKRGNAKPAYLINISKIPELRTLAFERGLSIGPLIPFREVEKSPAIREIYTALFEAAQSVSSVQIKNMGTLGGNLCHASPAADSAPPLIAFDAQVKVLTEKGERTLPLEEFFVGPGETVLLPEEMLVSIEVPELSGPTGSAFLKMTRVAADLAKVNTAVIIARKDGICRDCRIVLGAVFKTPLRVKKAEAILRGKKPGKDLVEEASQLASEEIQPITDNRSTAWYRKEVSKVLVRKALGLAWRRAGGMDIF